MAYTTIDKPTDYFNTKLYTGNGNTTQSITEVGFQPDWVWLKNRDSTDYHRLVDIVRGATKTVYSNDSQVEVTNDSNGYIASFDTDGLTVNKASGNGTNTSGNKYVSWNWKAGGSASSNSNGSITSSVSANTTAGFSIVSYTGTGSNSTVGHGLGAVPRMIIVKRRDGSDSWVVQHGSLGSGKALNLDSTGAVQTYDPYWNGTEPTSSVFSIGNDGRTNGSSETYIAYCFAEKKGYSKFSSYVGNGNSDGTFVYLGFKPAWIMIKNTGGDNWVMFDNKREGYNPDNDFLQPNTSNSEATESGAKIDLLSNGFKLRGSGGGIGQTNNSGSTFIYMAFAENPFVTSTGIPTTAR